MTETKNNAERNEKERDPFPPKASLLGARCSACQETAGSDIEKKTCPGGGLTRLEAWLSESRRG